MKIINVVQGSAEWVEARRCMVTGTDMDSVMGSNLDRLMLACELIAEEATEQTKVFKTTLEMERGTNEEVFARRHFEKKTGKKVEELGFCISDEFSYLGVSGDGWIKSKNVYTEAFETKSPDTKNAIFYKLGNLVSAQELGLGSFPAVTKNNPIPVFQPNAKAMFLGIPSQYKWQVATYFIVNQDLQKLHFAIYDARFINEESQMHIVEIKRADLADNLIEAREKLISFRQMWLRYRDMIIKDNF
jgi:hypothetical protein